MPRVLVLDADAGSAEMISRFFRPSWETSVVSRVEDAINSLRRAPADLVVVRHRAGGIDGITFTARCRREAPGVEVLVVFARGQGPVGRGSGPGPRYGTGYFFLEEPFSRTQLLHAADRTIRLGSRVRGLLAGGLGLAYGAVRVGPWTEPPDGKAAAVN